MIHPVSHVMVGSYQGAPWMFFPSSLVRRHSMELTGTAVNGRTFCNFSPLFRPFPGGWCNRHLLQRASFAHWRRSPRDTEGHYALDVNSRFEVRKSSCDAQQPDSYRECGMAVQDCLWTWDDWPNWSREVAHSCGGICTWGGENSLSAVWCLSLVTFHSGQDGDECTCLTLSRAGRNSNLMINLSPSAQWVSFGWCWKSLLEVSPMWSHSIWRQLCTWYGDPVQHCAESPVDIGSMCTARVQSDVAILSRIASSRWKDVLRFFDISWVDDYILGQSDGLDEASCWETQCLHKNPEVGL